ncbi:hypothetical protein KKC45_02800 [Patescibacteria group bacterium]|nr:hypothetical protein [Patescibacteria group bacterium]
MKTIYSSGIAVAVTPFLGIPYSWKMWLLVALGAVIFVKGYSYYRKDKREVKQLETSFEQNEQPVESIVREVLVEESEETFGTEESDKK